MIPPTLGLDISIKHTHLQTLARQDKERQGEETCQRQRSRSTHSAPGRTRTAWPTSFHNHNVFQSFFCFVLFCTTYHLYLQHVDLLLVLVS